MYGEWGEAITIVTKEAQTFDQASFGNCAQFISKPPLF